MNKLSKKSQDTLYHLYVLPLYLYYYLQRTGVMHVRKLI